MMKFFRYLVLGVGCWLMAACTSVVQNPTKVDELPDIYPDYTGVTIPVGIAPLNFDWATDEIVCLQSCGSPQG